MNMDSCFRRNDGMGPDESGLLQQLVTLDSIWGPSAGRHPGRRPGVYFDRLKVAGDIPSLSGKSSAVSSRIVPNP
jgi:hypothetical protein